jgi:hypothetical protein
MVAVGSSSPNQTETLTLMSMGQTRCAPGSAQAEQSQTNHDDADADGSPSLKSDASLAPRQDDHRVGVRTQDVWHRLRGSGRLRLDHSPLVVPLRSSERAERDPKHAEEGTNEETVGCVAASVAPRHPGDGAEDRRPSNYGDDEDNDKGSHTGSVEPLSTVVLRWWLSCMGLPQP